MDDDRGRRSSSRSSSDPHRHVPTLPDLAVEQSQMAHPQQHARRPSSASVSSSSRRQSFNTSTASGANVPPRHSHGFTAEEIVNAMEFEQESIVNRLQKELSSLRAQQDHPQQPGQGTLSTSSTGTTGTGAGGGAASLSRNSSNRSVTRHGGSSSNPNSPRLHAEESITEATTSSMSFDAVEMEALRRENDMLKRRIRELNQKGACCPPGGGVTYRANGAVKERSGESEMAQKAALELSEQVASLSAQLQQTQLR